MTANQPVTATIEMKRWRAYPAYRAVGIDWLGEVPAHWDVKRLRFFAAINPNREPPPSGSQIEVSFLPMEKISEDGRLCLDETRRFEEVAQGYTHFRNEDIIIAKITPCFENGKGALCEGLLNGLGFGTTELHVLRAGEDLDPKFAFYLTRSRPFRALGAASMYGAAGQQRVPEEFLKDFPTAVPGLTEQRIISAFLNRETAKIDALIAKRQQLIALLEEKRTALISRAVTKGLDPSVPMQESGVEWLGEIPAHWTSRRLRHISDEITVGVVVNPSSYVSDEGVPFLLGGDIREFCINTSNCNRCTLETSSGPLGKSQLNAGDVVVVRVGYPGVAAVVTPDLQGANCASMMLVRKHPRFISQWLAYAFNSKVGRDQIDIVQYGAAQKQFNISHAVDFSFPFPPLEEQRAIADHLDRTRAKIDQIIAKMEATITCMQEYRTALISAAVTGKIDVRGEV